MAKRISRKEQEEIKKERLKQTFGETYFVPEFMKGFDSDDEEEIGNFSYVCDNIKRIHDHSYDLNVPAKHLEVVADQEKIFLKTGIESDASYKTQVHFSKYGFDSICVALGVSATYLKRCIESGAYQLTANNLNHWIQTYPETKSVLLRSSFYYPEGNNEGIDENSLQGVLHGFLSSKYLILDDKEIYDQIESVLGANKQFVVKNALVSETLSKIRLVSREKFKTKNGDELSYGFDISNSRTGRSSVKFSFLLFRWACSNGMLFDSAKGVYFAQRHLGSNPKNIREDLKNFIQKMPALTDYAKGVVEKTENMKVAVSQTQNIVDQFLAMKMQDSIVNEFSLKLSESFQKNGTLCYWDVANIMTALAKTKPVQMREKMESGAAKFLLRNIK